MAIRFTPEYNKRIYKVVRAYNKRVERANKVDKIGKSYIPEKASIYQLKHNYETREQLDKELKNLEKYTRFSSRVRRAGFLSEYDEFLIENNREEAREFFKRQYEVHKRNAKPYDSDAQATAERFKHGYERLSKRLDDLTESEKQLLVGDIDDYRIYYNRQGAGYRGFLEEVDVVMINRGVPPEKRNAYFRKLNKLTPEEFYEMYVESDAVQRIYELLDSPEYKESGKSPTELELNDPDGERVDSMLEELDQVLDLMLKKKNK